MKYTLTKDRESSHVLLFGDPKTGKSTLASKLAEHYNILWISCDAGHSVLRKLPQEAQERIEIVILPDTPDYPVAISSLLRIMSGAPVHICDSHGQRDCAKCKGLNVGFTSIHLNELGLDTVVVIDNLSQIAESAINFVTKDEKKKQNKTDDDFYKLDYDDWARVGQMMNKIMNNIQQGHFHCVALAHTIEGEMEDGKKRIVPNVGSRNYSTRAGGFFDHIVYCQVKNKDHKFGSSTTYEANVITGSRGDVAIENMKPSELSLKPFFDGTVSAPKEERKVAANSPLVKPPPPSAATSLSLSRLTTTGS